MSAATISFYVSAAIALLAALVTVLARGRERALAGFAIAFAAMLVPLVQLGATTVAGVMLLATAVIVTLLGGLTSVRGEAPRARSVARRLPIAYWGPAALGLLGFGWVLLATGSRQVVEFGASLKPQGRFGDGDALLIELGNEFVVPALLIALLALCAVIAAVLTRASETS
jgi:NADH:ubiquinone oxidoreductase subunit 6 (subunit J)